MKTKMFEVEGHRILTYNPIVGCLHRCVYCYARHFAKRLGEAIGCEACKAFVPHLHVERMEKIPESRLPVFLCSMSDLFAEYVPTEWIQWLLKKVSEHSNTEYFLLTKNPWRWLDFRIPLNVTLGVTIESDLNYHSISLAPLQSDRISFLISYRHMHPERRIFVSIEPVLKFNERFSTLLKWIKPDFVYVGYDNWGNRLPEPSLEDTERLISELEEFTEVRKKTIRKAWWEGGNVQ